LWEDSTIKNTINSRKNKPLKFRLAYTGGKRARGPAYLKIALAGLLTVLLLSSTALAHAAPAVGEEIIATSTTDFTAVKAIAAALTIGLGAVGAAIAMGIAIAKSSESIARQPEAESGIRTSLLLGLVFIETAIIYTLVVAIMIIFVL
jgi:F-type H+-transporting ATPase subunit c